MAECPNIIQTVSSHQELLAGTTYLVTEDLSKVVEDWCQRINKPCPDKHFMEGLMEPLCNALQTHCFSDNSVKVVALPRESFADILDRNRSYDAKRLDEFWVSLDMVYANVGELKRDGFIISTTRFVDRNDIDIGRGPRPESGYHSIEEQIEVCYRSWLQPPNQNKRPVVLIDDGVFSGKTIVEVLKILAKKGIYVESVRLGVANPNAINEIASWKDETTGHRIKFLGCLKLCPPVMDWVCERDFFPGVPLSGRAVGIDGEGGMAPLLACPSNKPVRKPYLYPYGDIKKWASIKRGFTEFTKDALEISITLWKNLEDCWGQQIRVADLECIPWYAYSKDPLEMGQLLDERWVDILAKARQVIRG